MSDRPIRIASHDDDPSAPFADRLLLALGIAPEVVAEFGEQTVIDAAVLIKTDAHKFPMVVEDYGAVIEEQDGDLRARLDAAETVIAAVEAWGPHTPRRVTRALTNYYAEAVARARGETP